MNLGVMKVPVSQDREDGAIYPSAEQYAKSRSRLVFVRAARSIARAFQTWIVAR